MSNVSYKLLHKLALQDDGPSNTLQALLTSTLETTIADGRPRHSEQAQQNLIKVIASHSYAKVIFPLCHFMVVAAQRKIPLYYWFTMAQPMTASNLANSLRSAGDQISPDNHTNMENQFLVTIASGNYKFDVNLSHIAKHSALFDLIMEIIGYEKLEILYNKLACAKNRHEIASLSNDLARGIYQFLKDHFPTASTEKKARCMHDFLAKCTGENASISTSDINDALIIDFWLKFSLDAQSKFRLFSNCAHSWVTYRQAIRLAASNRFQKGASLDALNEQGLAEIDRIDQDSAQVIFDQITEGPSSTAQLRQINPSILKTVKLVNAKEFDHLAQLIKFGTEGYTLALTILRLLTFAPVQARLVEASRKRKIQANAMYNLTDDDAYSHVVDHIKILTDTIRGLTKAAAFSLYLTRSPNFIYAAVPLADTQEQEALRNASAKIRASLTEPMDEILLAEKISAELLEKLPKIMPVFFARLQQARKRFRRKGLGKLPNGDLKIWIGELTNGIEVLSDVLPMLNRLTSAKPALKNFHTKQPTLKSCFAEDRDIFFAQFRQIYGHAS